MSDPSQDPVPPTAEPVPAPTPVPGAFVPPEVVVPPAPPVAGPDAVVPPQAPVAPQPDAAQPYATAPQPYTVAAPPPYAVAAAAAAARANAATALRVPWGHAAVAALALAGFVLNIAGGLGFPSNAPAEQIICFGISVDLVAAFLVSVAGLILSLARPAVRPSLIFPWLGLGFSVIVFLAWAVTANGLYETLFLGGRGRYMNDAAAPFVLGAVWVLGAAFSSFGLRRAGARGRNIPAIVGIALWAIVLAGVVASSLLYGADLTD